MAASAGGARFAAGADSQSGGQNSGHVKAYQLKRGEWQQIGGTLTGAVDARFGRAVDMSASGSFMVVGAPGETGAGEVTVYNLRRKNWRQVGSTLSESTTASPCSPCTGEYGASVAMSAGGGTIAVGFPASNLVRVFQFRGNRRNGDWRQVGPDISGSGTGFGSSVSLSSNGKTLAIGNPNDDTDTGKVILYSLQGSQWVALGDEVTGEASGDLLGSSTALSGDGKLLVTGVPGATSDLGNAQAFTFFNN